jgi:N-acetylglutamate synthase-like GNAT family acetyltransferase
MTLQEFLDRPRVRNAWLREPDMKVYVRRGCYRWWEGELHTDTIDIASISVDEEKRGTGVFTEFLGRVEELGKTIFIENVLDTRFQDFFRERGYTVARGCDPDIPVCSFVWAPQPGEKP